MSAVASANPFELFFLRTRGGDRFCIFHPPAGSVRGAVLYLHPFAEEMNKSRRMAALQSRSFAASGYAVLQIDLLGCGDSAGDFGDATWDAWRQDVVAGVEWLRRTVGGEVTLWGLRLGALLAVDSAPLCASAPKRFILWQPVTSGSMMLGQFLRLRVASEMLAAGKAASGVDDLRRRLVAGETVEIAGYDLTHRLTGAIDALSLAAIAPANAVVHWFELVRDTGRPLPVSSQRVIDQWVRSGARVDAHCVAGEPFWSTLEISECRRLVDATTTVTATTT